MVCRFESSQIKAADSTQLREIFLKYASSVDKDERLMTAADFAQKFLGIVPEEGGNVTTTSLITGAADQTKDGKISFAEFQAFETALRLPDALYVLAFQLFDVDCNGAIDLKEFKDVLSKTTMHELVPFDANCPLVKTYFGPDGSRKLDYAAFSQLIQEVKSEYLRQAFLHFDTKKNGTISALDLAEILKAFRKGAMSEFVEEHLVTVGGGHASHTVTYSYYKAFNGMLDKLPLLEHIFSLACRDSSAKEVTKEELLASSRQFSQVTPLEIDILFELCNLNEQTGRVHRDDLRKLMPRLPPSRLSASAGEAQASQDPYEYKEISVGMQVLESVYRFMLGGIAGAMGATAVYPIDLVKTRMQNQRSTGMVGELMYKNSIDCFLKVIRNEGPLGLYRGLLPQLVGVAPEKAIKLTVNDLMRGKMTRKDGSIPFWGEMLSGGCGGGCQVMFTNPLEIVKIRLQVQGEVKDGRRVGAAKIIRELGFRGLYKGASACFMRDIPFSAIYFPTYAHMKSYLGGDEPKKVHFMIAGFIAGVPAAGLLTPADVIKTRLQVKAREGQRTYNGLFDCMRKIYADEGGRAFWKGAGARICRSSPQFAVTLFTYEFLQSVFDVDFGRAKKPSHNKASPLPPLQHSDFVGGLQHANTTFAGVERHFGLVLPRFAPRTEAQQQQAR
ncbi:electrogenic aspartate/glutamate antiporter SLC25A12, mitochondrial-like isoform X1 [Sycon ciliatum]|uniref:electrogenic aspartate/glutamate antiporter SLC25A12, mitochondrial-like isoform X1 n=1 Tax=Sycon ciliatum TaxID=27933 RepID=UPI0031F6D3CF